MSNAGLTPNDSSSDFKVTYFFKFRIKSSELLTGLLLNPDPGTFQVLAHSYSVTKNTDLMTNFDVRCCQASVF